MVLPVRRSVPCVSTSLKVFSYSLPRRYAPRRGLHPDLEFPTQAYEALAEFFARCAGTSRPSEADFFFVPVNLIKHQYANEDPGPDLLPRLRYLGERKDHMLVATLPASQRSKKNHFGEAYLETYDWLDPFVLLANESTSDLIEGQDVGIFPYHTLADGPADGPDPGGDRPLLYSFLGTFEHRFLPETHVRTRMARLQGSAPEMFVGTRLENELRARLRPHPDADDYELLARNSIFTLAPAGYGRSTYRFFQSIQWGSVPVMLSDDYVTPFAESIPWDSFTLTIPERELDRVDEIIRGIPPERIEAFRRNLALNQHHFTKRGFFELLVKRLERMRDAR